MAKHCETCGQQVGEYKYKMSKGAIRVLQSLFQMQKTGYDYFYYKDFNEYGKACDWPYMRYFGVVEAMPRVKGQNCTGYWRLTEKGKQFLRGELLLPTTVHLEGKTVIQFSGDDVSVDSLVPEWNYERNVLGAYA